MGVVTLAGEGWGPWRGGWTSRRRLLCSGGRWSLVDGVSRAGRWASLGRAMEELWPGRRVRGAHPWAVGWIGYEELARFAGDLPAAGDAPGLQAWLLVEPGPCRPVEPRPGAPAGARWRSSPDSAGFEAGVGDILERIERGEVYQVNLTRRFSLDGWEGGLGPLLDAVRNQPPPYLAWMQGDGHELLCASMELLLRRRGERCETRPIKGTRPRHLDPGADAAAARELAQDPKERAELSMVVDLERNDLGRLAVPGSVVVADDGSVESYAAVHHRVARIGARVPLETPWWELLRAMAPGGSVTGCPKRAAMEVIRELEAGPRGPYTGALGVVTGDGDLELALPIRTAWREGRRLHAAAGCGIVWGSDPGREEEESRLKVARWLNGCGTGGNT